MQGLREREIEKRPASETPGERLLPVRRTALEELQRDQARLDAYVRGFTASLDLCAECGRARDLVQRAKDEAFWLSREDYWKDLLLQLERTETWADRFPAEVRQELEGDFDAFKTGAELATERVNGALRSLRGDNARNLNDAHGAIARMCSLARQMKAATQEGTYKVLQSLKQHIGELSAFRRVEEEMLSPQYSKQYSDYPPHPPARDPDEARQVQKPLTGAPSPEILTVRATGAPKTMEREVKSHGSVG